MMKALICLVTALMLAGCAAPAAEEAPAPSAAAPDIPAHLALDEAGVPQLEVYVLAEGVVEPMDIERYVAGVVAGEMRSDWPEEALKAQAILARTFVLKFVAEKDSRYAGADISTDIAEAQAYDADAVDERILAAVSATEGMVLSTEGGVLPYAWFHAHSGGTTALAREGLGWREAEPGWTKVTEGLDSPDAPPEAQAWEASFSEAEVLAAWRSIGPGPESLERLKISKKGDSGRAVTLEAGGVEVSAAELRLALGSTVMRSTLLTELRYEDGKVIMAGRGYGHGVGMPQWGAYALAQDGYTGEELAVHYFDGLHVVTLWGSAR